MITTQLAGDGTLGSLTSMLATAGGFLTNVLEDPALPAVTNLVQQVYTTEKARATAKTPSATPTGPKVPGVGLSKLVKPLQTYLWVRQNPVKAKLIAVGVLLAPVLLGMGIGRWTKRCRT